MSKINHNLTLVDKRKRRVRGKIHGTAKRPRLTVSRSNLHLYLQVIDDDKQKTIVSANDIGKNKKTKGTKTEKAKLVATELLAGLKKAKVKKLVFDRGEYKYHGRIKAVAETLREGGIKL